jgi:hypothetical protein
MADSNITEVAVDLVDGLNKKSEERVKELLGEDFFNALLPHEITGIRLGISSAVGICIKELMA